MKYLIGIGNYSMGDDAVGLKIVEYIDKQMPHRDFEVIDMSDNGLNIVAYLHEGTEKILFVDSVFMERNPGESLVFRLDQVETGKELSHISTHEGDMIKILSMVQEVGYHLPPIRFLGIQPLSCDPSQEGLSDLIAEKLPEYVALALKTLNQEW